MTQLQGKFLVIDGGEGCGKSTQARMLHEHLAQQGILSRLVHDPGTTRIGGLIRGILLDPQNTDMGMRCEMLLYMAARAQMMRQLIVPALADGEFVISDRFISSTLAYQVGGDGLTAKDIKLVGDVAIDGRWPDLTIILDIPVDRAGVRVIPQHNLFGHKSRDDQKDRIEQRSVEYHEQVRKNYLAQAKSDRKRYRVIDADRDPQSVHHDVLRCVTELAKGNTE